MDLRKEENIGVMPICNSLSLIVRDCILDVDSVWYQYSDEESAKKAPLNYDMDGDPHFELNGERYYLNEFVLVNRQ